MILLAVAPSLAAVVVPFDCGSADQPIVGVPGLEVRCVHEPAEDGSTWETVKWTFGDGAVAEGDAVSHVYADAGQFTVSLELDGWAPPPGIPLGEDQGDPYWSAHGFVTVCGPPEPAFTTVFLGALDVQLVNESAIAVHCLSDLQWEVFRGADTAGDPALTFDVWQPRVTVPEEGTWTVRLTMGGIGGTSASDASLDVSYGLPDGIDVPGTRDYDCQTGPGPVGATGVLLALALVAGRRRRSVR